MLYVLKKRKKEEKKKKKIEQCHKLLLVLGGDLVQTHSYSRTWQVAQIGLCGRGAVCGALAESIKNLNCPLAACAGDL